MAVLLSLGVCRSFNLKVFVLSLLALHVSAKMYSGCYTGAISEISAESSALHGYVTETFSVHTLLECQLNCVKLLPKCKSSNYKERWNDSLNTCEISTISKDLANVEDFVKYDESIYGEVLNTTEEPDNQDVCRNQNANGLNSSLILKRKDDYIKQLLLWLNNKEWSLLYRAFQDGWEANDFHSRCDNKGPTVTIIEVGQYIFGGYTDVSWGGPRGYKESTESFLFSLRNNDNLEPFKSSVYRSPLYAIYQNPSYGATFGIGYDINIKSEANTRSGSYTNFGCTYELPPGYAYGQENTRALLAGSYNNFLLTELEVLYLCN